MENKFIHICTWRKNDPHIYNGKMHTHLLIGVLLSHILTWENFSSTHQNIERCLIQMNTWDKPLFHIYKWQRICSTCRKTSWYFPLSWLFTGSVTKLTRRVSLLEPELLTLSGHLSSPSVFSGVRSLILCVCFVNSCLSFVSFILAIVLPVLLRYTDSDYPFGIFKLFFLHMGDIINSKWE